MKKNFRAIWSLLLAVLVVFGLSACGTDSDSDTTGDTSSSSSSGGDATSSSGGDATSSGGDMTTGPSNQTCADLINCLNGAADEAAQTACSDDSTTQAQSDAGALGNCIQTNGCDMLPEADQAACLEQNCATEVSACSGGGGGDCSAITQVASTGETCNQTMPCADGALCIVTEAGATDGVCQQPCVPNECEDFCTMDEVCSPLQNGGGACAPNPVGSCDEIVQATATGATCNQSAPCENGAVCIVEASGSADGTCRQACVPNQCENFCAMGDICAPLQNGGGACGPSPVGTCDTIVQASEINQACGQTSGACPDGAVCIITMQGATEGTCLQACIPTDCEQFCAMGQTCNAVPGSGGGACQ